MWKKTTTDVKGAEVDMRPVNKRKERQIAKKMAPRVMTEALLAVKEAVNTATLWKRSRIAFCILRGRF